MGMFGFVSSESESREEIWQQQLSATDAATAIRAAGSVTGAGGVTVGNKGQLNTGLQITAAKGSGPVTLNVGDTTGAGISQLGSVINSSLGSMGQSIRAAIDSVAPLAESKQTGGQTSYLKYILYAAVAIAAIYFLPKLWR